MYYRTYAYVVLNERAQTVIALATEAMRDKWLETAKADGDTTEYRPGRLTIYHDERDVFNA